MRRFRSALSLQPDEQLMALNLMIRKTTTKKKDELIEKKKKRTTRQNALELLNAH